MWKNSGNIFFIKHGFYSRLLKPSRIKKLAILEKPLFYGWASQGPTLSLLIFTLLVSDLSIFKFCFVFLSIYHITQANMFKPILNYSHIFRKLLSNLDFMVYIVNMFDRLFNYGVWLLFCLFSHSCLVLKSSFLIMSVINNVELAIRDLLMI